MLQCENTFYLNEHEHKEDRAEKDWITTLLAKQDLAVTRAIKIMLREVDQYTFELAFGKDYINVSDELEELLITTLEDMEMGIISDLAKARSLAELALDAACFALYQCSDQEIFEFTDSYRQAVDEVLTGVAGEE